MPPATVMEFRTNEKAGREVAVLTLQQSLVTLDATLTTLRAEVAAATDDLAALQSEHSRLRQQIDLAQTPAEEAALVELRKANRMAQRIASAHLAAKQDALARTEAERIRTAALLDLGRAQLAQATTDLAAAVTADAQRAQWRAALAGPALAAVVADAKSSATENLATTARTRLANLLGASELLQLLVKRYADAVSAVDEVAAAAARHVDAFDALRTSYSATEGAAVASATAFGRVQDTVRDLTESAATRLAWSKAALQAAAGAASLPPEDEATIAAAIDDAKAAAAKEGPVHDARVTERAKLAALEKKALPKEAADPAFDRSTLTEHTTWHDAVQTRENAEGEFTDTMKASLDEWEVALPPALVAAATGYVRAAAIVDELKAVKPGDLGTALAAAEQAYAEALAAKSAADQRLQVTGQLVAARIDEVAIAARVRDTRVAALVRGDA